MADTISSTRRAALWMGIATVFSPCLAQADVPPQSRMRAAWERTTDDDERHHLKHEIMAMTPATADDLMLQAEVMRHDWDDGQGCWLYGYRTLVDNILILAKSGVLA
jgi:hypothetical protein